MRIRWLMLVLVAGCTSAGATTLHSASAVEAVRQDCKPLNAKSAVVHCTPVPAATGER